MGLLSHLLGTVPPAPPAVRVEPQIALETRRGNVAGWSDGWGVASLGHGPSPVAPHLAEGLSSVLACIELITGILASLPATLTQDGPDGQVPAPASATAWALLRRPNPRQSWPACMASMAASMLLSGNGVASIQRDGRGAAIALVPVPWPWLAPQIIQGAGGPRLVYDVVTNTPEANLLGLPRRLLDSDVLHLRARSDEGVIGRSVLSRAAGVVQEGTELATAAAATWRNGMRPSGFFSIEQVLTPDNFDRLQANVARYQGAMATGRVPVLMGGAKFQNLAMSSVDAEFLASRHFAVAEIARLFGVPLGLLQPGTGVQPYEAMLAAFAQTALSPIVTAIEAEFDYAILPPGMHLQLDMAGLLRGNFSSMIAALCAAVQSKVMTPNDARRAIGLPAVDDGDTLASGPAPSLPADAKGMPHMGQSPGKTGDGLPAPGTNANEGAGG